MKLFVISCSYHAQISQLSAYLALKHLPGITELIFLWDDLLPNLENQPEPHKFINKNVINFSSFQSVNLIQDGWIRQQIVKLQLHHITNDESFYVLDGDTLLRNTIDLRPNKVLGNFDVCYQPYFDFITNELKLKKLTDFSFISPLLLLERNVLTQLEQYCHSIYGYDIANLYLNTVAKYPPRSFSECELYGTFATQILNKQYEPIINPFKNVYSQNQSTDRLESLFFSTNDSLVLYGCDMYVDKQFWRNLAPVYRDFSAFKIGFADTFYP